MSFTRTAGYRHASLNKGPLARLAARLPLAVVGGGALPSHFGSDSLVACPRADLPAASQAAAARDPAFRADVTAGDAHRDEGAWAEAEASYAAALARHPYHGGYWVQLGHMRKEQQQFARAEIAYRTAAALGAAPRDVTEHLDFVAARQDGARHPVRFAGPGATAQQVPAQPDVLLLARLLWRAHGLSDGDMLALLREAESLDALFAAMVEDPRFARANVEWLNLMRDGDLG